MTSVPHRETVIGLILAGGLARRLGGGDKGLRCVGGEPILSRVIDRLRPQVAGLALSANGDGARFARWGLPVLRDPVPDHPGPLAGILAGLEYAAGLGVAWVVSAPADAPFLPPDLVARLAAGRGEAPMAVAASAGRTHPVAALWPVSLRGRLRDALTRGERRVGGMVAGAAVIEWPDAPVDPFFNVNTPDDLLAAERIAVTL